MTISTANTAKEIFNALNEARISNGKKAYKSCKESKAIMIEKLNAEIELALDNAIINTPEEIVETPEEIIETPEDLTETLIDALLPTLTPTTGILESTLEEVKNNEELKNIRPEETPADETPLEAAIFTIPELAIELGTCPMKLRRKLRKLNNLPPTVEVEGKRTKWAFATMHKAEIIGLIG